MWMTTVRTAVWSVYCMCDADHMQSKQSHSVGSVLHADLCELKNDYGFCKWLTYAIEWPSHTHVDENHLHWLHMHMPFIDWVMSMIIRDKGRNMREYL